MVELAEELLLVHDGVDAPLGDDSGLEHLLHCKQRVRFLLLDLPDLSEPPSSDHVREYEIVFAHLYI